MQFRGHVIICSGEQWVYEDTGELVSQAWEERPCGHCGCPQTSEGHDGCLGTLPGVMNACCGHGVEREAYVQFWDGTVTSGKSAKAIQTEGVA